MESFSKNKTVLSSLIIFFTGIVALVDYIIPSGIIIWFFYLVPILLTYLVYSERGSYMLTALCGILMFVSYFLTPSYIPVEYAMFNRAMGLIVFVTIIYLVSHLKKSHTRINQINKRFDIAVRSASAGIWELDVKNGINTWDAAMFRIYGIDKSKFANIYEAWKNCLDPADAERADRVFSEALNGNGDYDDSFTIIRGDGEKRVIRSCCIIERDRKGKPVKATGINIDITDQKNAEENLLKLNDELKRSNKELENFAYIASHDLQEPLRMISSFTQLLEKRYAEKLDKEAHEFIRFIVDGSSHMQQLINDLLQYSRITTQAGPLKAVDVDIPLKRAIDNLQLKIEASHAELSIGEMPVICGDELHLVRLFQNLLENALKFSSNSHPKIEINCQSDFNAWLFSVKDYGIGIEKKNQEKIFDIFQRLNTRDKYPGTGIGLSICKKNRRTARR